MAMTIFVPPTVRTAVEEYAVPSSVHFHFSAPDERSYAMAPPFSSPPSCAMHRPSATKGDEDVKNRGLEPEKSVLRQSSLPLPASKQESVPRAPYVITLPSATVGELRGPGCRPMGSLAAADSYFSRQTSLPVAASRQTSSSSAS